jgi:hypothetical protein
LPGGVGRTALQAIVDPESPERLGVGTFQGAIMPKDAKTAAEPKGSQSSSEAIKPAAYKTLVLAVVAANATMEKGRKNKSELIRDAVDSDNLHAGAFRQTMALRKMDPVKRNEWLWHFELYCEREGFAREDLLPDRTTTDANGVARGTDEDGEPDLRPSHLRQPGASATDSAVDKIKNDALDKLGRGPQPKPN